MRKSKAILLAIGLSVVASFSACKIVSETTDTKEEDTMKENEDGITEEVSPTEAVIPTQEPTKIPESLKDHSALAKEFINIADPLQLYERNKERATSLAEQYYKDFFIEQTGFLKLYYPPEVVPKVKPRDQPATCWEYGALMSMQSQLAIMDEAQIPMLDKVNADLDYYGYPVGGELWGYVVHRGSAKMGATDKGLAYDDDEWLVINFLRSYEVTGNKGYLEKAEFLMNFVLREAWFEPLGGLFWDTRHEARHSCSNNPAIKPLVDLYKHTGKEEYLDWAKKIFEFSLKLKTDKNIYEDLIRARQDADGTWIEGEAVGGYYTYNTGTMISAGAALYGVTGEQRYLEEALSAAKGAYEHFAVKISDTVTYWPCQSNIWFNNILLRGYIDLYEYAPEQAEFYINTFQNSMDFAYDNYLYEGYLPINWVRGWGTQDRDKDLRLDSLDHSANIEMYAMLANWQGNRVQSAEQ